MLCISLVLHFSKQSVRTQKRVYTFEMFQPKFCEMLINEVPYNLSEHYEQFGVVLDDSGLETMLEKLMDDYLCPMSRVICCPHLLFFFHLTSFFLVFNVDDSEVTLNACLGEQFHGGDLFFHSVWCAKYVNTANQGYLNFQNQGAAVTGALCDLVFFILLVSNRKILIITTFRDEQFFVMVTIGHGARATISGHQVNLVIWCRRYLFFLSSSLSILSFA
ncbi:hypothetical protein POTOM_036060 [Populus tomentosa]|uniref:Uncharacterized protein n=1 Tax=Populus tomentosa TaxID=118781 RepID=A0A8X8CMR9_POPTO|nr:hypothetical protein POTOM_036060 [Populus tomentosa]